MLAIARLGSALLLAAAAASAAGAVGLGPLSHSGLTNSERKGFYLTLINPYPTRETFRLYGVEWDSEEPVARVRIPIDRPVLGPKSRRRMLVVDTGLEPGEEHRFRVCAERVQTAEEGMIHARVCSKLVARRVA